MAPHMLVRETIHSNRKEVAVGKVRGAKRIHLLLRGIMERGQDSVSVSSKPHVVPRVMSKPGVLQKMKPLMLCFRLLSLKSSGLRPAVPFMSSAASVSGSSGLTFSLMTCSEPACYHQASCTTSLTCQASNRHALRWKHPHTHPQRSKLQGGRPSQALQQL